jgi:hypothetical protein
VILLQVVRFLITFALWALLFCMGAGVVVLALVLFSL